MIMLVKIDEAHYRAAHPLVVNEKDGSVMIEVPAGEFEMGEERLNTSQRVYLDRYWIGIYCVSNRQYEQFVEETGHRAPNNNYWDKGYCANDPVAHVSMDDAVAYTKWVGCELPTEAQWEKAARGLKGFVYPWGNEWDAKKCRNNKPEAYEPTSVVWGYPGGASAYGTYNQSGNVFEWCADWWGGEKVIRGAWKESVGHRCCRSYWHRANDLGFRIARRF